MNTPRFGMALASLVAVAALFMACAREREQAPPEVTSASGATCSAHGAPKGLCFICDASLRDKGRLWCEEHDRYEDRCWECHPELQDKNRLWCKEHSLYEDECFLCHPELLEEETAPAAAALMCTEHGVPEQECGICHPELLNEMPPGQGLKVRLPSTESAGKAGIVVDTPGVDGVQEGVECFAELKFNQNKLAQITPLVAGVVQSVEVDLGSRVSQGALLARITSVAIGEAQSAYVKALAEDGLRNQVVERERSLYSERISSEMEVQEAEAAHQGAMAAVEQARQQLRVLGFDERQIEALAEQKGAPGVLEIRAPFAGEIVERTAVRGAMVEIGQPMFTLADTTALWAMVNIPESQLPRVQVGQRVELTVESLPGRTFPGKLTWLPATVDERTRMARARVEVANMDGRLKAQMFARALIVTSHQDRAVVVPQSAVQDVAGTSVLFIKSGADLFEARSVQLGATRDGHVEIVAGLNPGDQVVVAGGFALKSQFLISRLGAGCVD